MRQSKRRISTGTCALCSVAGISQRSITTHLNECPKRLSPAKPREKQFHLIVRAVNDPRYWVHVEASSVSTLRTLDAFLRDIWLECCGHMSSFTIDGTRYVAPEAGMMKEYGDQSMRVKLADVLSIGTQFQHEYDFGSTTELAIEVLDCSPIKTNGGPIHLLARNDPPEYQCHTCDHPATTLCMECAEDVEDPEDVDAIYYCAPCIDDSAKHAHDDTGMRLPVVNSPRMGVCGYEGSGTY